MSPASAATPEVLRPTRVEVDLSRIGQNLAAIRAHVGRARVMAILKANAYGHGLVEVARHLVGQGVECLGAAFLEEAITLRQSGIRAPILVLGSLAGEQIPRFLEHDLMLTASSVEKLDLIEQAAAVRGRRATVHLKVDTGMERVGIHHYNADRLLEASLRCRHVDVAGIYSHFASADAADLTFAQEQLERFQEVLRFYERRSLPTPLRHIANSGGILQLPGSHLDLVRPGILLYGYYPSTECRRTLPVTPALSWRSQVCYFKVIPAGTPVGYGSTWTSPRTTRIVTVPVGYGDGYSRALSNRAEVLIRGRRHPVVGRVCMDQLMVDIGGETAYNGDRVTLVGRDGDASIGADELAERSGTITHETLTLISARVPRVFVQSAPPATPPAPTN